MSVYLSNFSSIEDVAKEYANDGILTELSNAKVLVAWYGYGSYSGSSFVLYEKDGKLFEVNGGHCSCNGLEGQWEPEETSWQALSYILKNGRKFAGEYGGSSEVNAVILSLVKENYHPVFKAT